MLRTAGLAVFAVALCAGIAGGPSLVEALSATPKRFDRIFLLGPISCIAAGLALIAPDLVSLWLLLPATAIAAGAFGLTSAVYDPGQGDWPFAVAAGLVATWIAGSIFLVGRLFRGAWFAIATRILASWLTAIGVFLGAAHLLPGKTPPLPTESPGQPAALPLPDDFGARHAALTGARPASSAEHRLDRGARLAEIHPAGVSGRAAPP